MKLLECVGEGSYGQVWTARYYGTVICLKIFRCEGRGQGGGRLREEQVEPRASSMPVPPLWPASLPCRSGEAGVLMDDLKREAALMSTLRHPNGKRGRRRSGPGPHGRRVRRAVANRRRCPRLPPPPWPARPLLPQCAGTWAPPGTRQGC